MTTTISTVRQSPFRETEWDRRLDNMLEDLENSAAANSGGTCTTSSTQQQQSASVSHQMVSQSASQSSSSFQQQQRSASSSNRQASSSNNNNGAIEACSDTTASQQQNGYGSVLQKSKSGGSLVQENTDSLLKEMDNALKASSNFIESHRSSSTAGPNSRSTTEYHEYRSYSNGGTKGGNAGGEFNLERQVQHMMPPPSPSLSGLMERSNQQ